MANVETGRPIKKLTPKWEGPYEVTKTSSHAVTLKLPDNMKFKNTFHVSHVRKPRGKGIEG